MDFIVFSDDWGKHPSSCQHIFKQVSRTHRVIWVNTVGMRGMKLTPGDFGKASSKISRMLFGGSTPRSGTPKAADSNVTVLQPFMLPLPMIGWARALNAMSAGMSIKRAMRSLQFERAVVVATVPNACDALAKIEAEAVVYYCVDDFSQWPGHDKAAVTQMESALMERSNLLLATSEVLLERLARSGKPTKLLPHGVDLQHFGTRLPALDKVQSFVGPRAGFYGLLDERLDEPLLVALARSMPNWSFFFAGPRAASLDELARCANVSFLGNLAYEDLPRFTAGLTALLLPYVVNEFTRTISPLKLNEYLASGVPIVASRLPEVEKRVPWVSIATDLQEWQEGLSNSLTANIDARRQALAGVLESESWAARAQWLVSECAATVVATI